MPEVLHGLTSEFAHGRAFSEVYPVPAPAAGGGFTYTVGGAYWERLQHISFVLTTDGTAGNRTVILKFNDASGAALDVVTAAAVQTATTTYTYVYRPYATAGTSAVSLANVQDMPVIFLEPMYTVVVSIDTVKAGDQLSSIRFYRERFDTGPDGYPVGMVTESGRISAVEQLGN